MRQGIVRVSLSVLHEFLKLPPTTKLIRVRQTWEHEQHNLFEMLVESPNLNEVYEGHEIPWVDLIVTTDSHIKESKVENHLP